MLTNGHYPATVPLVEFDKESDYMAQLVPMPQLGSTMEEGTILKWLKREGDSILKGETLLEIETDKATMEVESPIDGVVLKLLFADDSVVAVQRPIAVLGSAGEPIEHLFGTQSGDAEGDKHSKEHSIVRSAGGATAVADSSQSGSLLDRAKRGIPYRSEPGVCWPRM